MAFGNPSQKLAKFLVRKLSSVTFDKITVKYYFSFAKEVAHQGSKWVVLMLTYSSLIYLLKRPSIFVPTYYITKEGRCGHGIGFIKSNNHRPSDH